MQLFYQADFTRDSKTIVFDPQESKHMFKVLRKKLGDHIKVSNGKGLIAQASIVEISQKQCLVKIINLESQAALPYYIHLAIAPTKSNDRLEWFLEKATEIGINEITPIITHHSERKRLKIDRCERVIQAAAKQSLKYYKPKINSLTSFSDCIKSNQTDQKFIAHCEDSNEKKDFIPQIEKHKSYLVLIGPEGDFSSEEIISAKSYGFSEISLSNQRLRTETAGIVATHLLNLAQDL